MIEVGSWVRVKKGCTSLLGSTIKEGQIGMVMGSSCICDDYIRVVGIEGNEDYEYSLPEKYLEVV